MKSITFGPVTHVGKSYAYALGYGAYMMSSYSPCPYHKHSHQRPEYIAGFAKAKEDTSKALGDYVEEHS